MLYLWHSIGHHLFGFNFLGKVQPFRKLRNTLFSPINFFSPNSKAKLLRSFGQLDLLFWTFIFSSSMRLSSVLLLSVATVVFAFQPVTESDEVVPSSNSQWKPLSGLETKISAPAAVHSLQLKRQPDVVSFLAFFFSSLLNGCYIQFEVLFLIRLCRTVAFILRLEAYKPRIE